MNKKKLVVVGFSPLKNQMLKLESEIKDYEIQYIGGKGLKSSQTLQDLLKDADAVMLGSVGGDENFGEFLEFLKTQEMDLPIIPVGDEMIQSNIGSVKSSIIQEINSYFIFGGDENITESFYYIGKNILRVGIDREITPPIQLPFDGIFHPDTDEVFKTFDQYRKWYKSARKETAKGWIGILIHRAYWVGNQRAIPYSITRQFEAQGIGVVPVFSYGSSDENSDIKNFDQIVDAYFSSGSSLVIEGLINMQMILDKNSDFETNMFENVVGKFKKLDIPVFRPIMSNFSDEKSWNNDPQGLPREISWSFTTPERQGMIEPIIIGCRDSSGNQVPIEERIVKFCSRAVKWLRLRKTENKDKKIAICLHNAPCSGVEATTGMAIGLDTFQSTVDVLDQLKLAGYSLGKIPEDGRALYKEIMEKKAIADFRWTTVEDIVKEGGCLYKMNLQGEDGYLSFYNRLSKKNIDEIEEMWGAPPGEGMVFDDQFIITGLQYGNITVFVQPKRGCYGSKCTGEVCKILHDPSCPPPHQYMATYHYLQNVLKVHAIVDMGTAGNLEFLPGKINALSGECYSDILIGDIPHVHIYHSGIPNEGIAAKRRAYAVTIDHLPSAFSSNPEALSGVKAVDEYLEASASGSLQEEFLKSKVEKILKKYLTKKELDGAEENFEECANKLRDQFAQTAVNCNMESLHVFGKVPEKYEATALIKEIIENDSPYLIELKKDMGDEMLFHEAVSELIEKTINGKKPEIQIPVVGEILKEIQCEILEIHSNVLSTGAEMINLIRSLDGAYIEPGPSGMPSDNGKNVIPTGKNFYMMDTEKIPTKAAYDVGVDVANQLLEMHYRNENRYPEKIAMHMISVDISLSKGEQLSQILYLIGVRPLWRDNGKVEGFEIIPLEELNRPRIDVTLRISGILRDSYPEVIEYLDRAIRAVSSLNEPLEMNYVKKNSMEMQKELEKSGFEPDERRSTMRIFGDRPGTYGAGVDLALKASAWKTEEDLAKVFIEFSSYAYGEKLSGDKAQHEFIENIKGSEVSYDTTNSRKYDVIACGASASVSGGFGIMKKIFSGKEMKRYHSSPNAKDRMVVKTLEDELRKKLSETMFNPLWKEAMKNQGALGAANLMKRIQNIFEWQCMTESFENKDIDQLVEQYVNNPEMKKWFQENNEFALEEIARRFLELHQREKWDANESILYELQKSYLEIEGDMEEKMENTEGEFQGGSIEVLNDDDILSWKEKLKYVNEVFQIKNSEKRMLS
ncbi:cobaltochelatase subunit CobN [uncultured Ilyobacter sp.]|uniref:cobaltochelatase subunit CobN n=1 Tax=uncultured Ilyobacter sp. TaxID=544433 RepID=UPI0029C6DD5D|nr:cobaltochelatase subunit CobN [uncultured Ilyobacter sp.]